MQGGCDIKLFTSDTTVNRKLVCACSHSRRVGVGSVQELRSILSLRPDDGIGGEKKKKKG